MTQGYFGFCSMEGPRIVGSWRAQAPRMRWGVPSTETGAHVCTGVCPAQRTEPKRVCARGVSSPQAGAQTPRVPT
jgi:hypothetical protein